MGNRRADTRTIEGSQPGALLPCDAPQRFALSCVSWPPVTTLEVGADYL